MKLLLVFTLTTSLIFAQKPTKELRLKTYYYEGVESGLYVLNIPSNTNLQNPNLSQFRGYAYNKTDTYFSFAIQFNEIESYNFHELEIKKLNFAKRNHLIKSDSLANVIRDKDIALEASLSYEYNNRILKNTKKVNFYIGIGVNPYLSKRRDLSFISTDFDYSISQMGISLSIIPRAQLLLTNKVALEFKLQPDFFSFEKKTTITEDPLLLLERRRLSYNDISFIGSGERFYSRTSLGISYKL